MNWFLVVILCISIAGSAIAYYYDYRYPFSTAKKAAEYIESEYDLDELIVIGYSFHAGETIAGYLNKELYYPYSMNENKFSKSLSWSEMQWSYDVNLPIQTAYSFLIKGNEVLLIISTECEEELLIKNGFSKIEKDFSNSIVPYEYFNLYVFENDIEQLILTDYIHYFVINAYSSFLDRAPTQKELVEWVYFLKYKKGSASEFIRRIITDDTFIQRNVDNSLFIEILYEGLLQRKPDKIGFENWTQWLKDNSRKQLLDKFLNSEEFKNICRDYSIAQ
jgi:hypothetical protein